MRSTQHRAFYLQIRLVTEVANIYCFLVQRLFRILVIKISLIFKISKNICLILCLYRYIWMLRLRTHWYTLKEERPERIRCWISRKCDSSSSYNQGQKLHGQLRKTTLSLTPQAMNKQFKRPSAGSVRELYYIYRKT